MSAPDVSGMIEATRRARARYEKVGTGLDKVEGTLSRLTGGPALAGNPPYVTTHVLLRGGVIWRPEVSRHEVEGETRVTADFGLFSISGLPDEIAQLIDSLSNGLNDVMGWADSDPSEPF